VTEEKKGHCRTDIVIDGQKKDHQILVCNGTFCGREGKAINLIKKFKQVVTEMDLDKTVKVTFSGCFGYCPYNSNVGFLPGTVVYSKIKERHVEEVVRTHVVEGKILEKKKYPGPK